MTPPERPEGREADPRMGEFDKLMADLLIAENIRALASYRGDLTEADKSDVGNACDALRAFVAAQLAERPEPIGNATVVTQASGPMAGTLGEYTDLRIGQIIPRGIYALTLVGKP